MAGNITTFPVPGHTRGSVLYLVDDHLLFSGDSLSWDPRRKGLHAFREACWYSWPEQTAALFKELGLESPSCHGGLPVGDNKNKIMVSSSTPFLPAGTGQVDLVAAAKVATFTEIIAVELDSYEGDMIDLGVECEIVQKSGAWLNYGEMRLGQGKENAKQFMIDNPEVMAEIEAKVLEAKGIA